ncbi:MAG: GlmU family protein [Flavobacteriia bacterium]|nr:GlmU family protein [Flavobacteriia bacterium]
MNLIMFDGPQRDHLLPLTFTRPVSELRTGILTIREKWEIRLEAKATHLTQPYLSALFPLKSAKENLLVNGAVCPDMRLLAKVIELKKGQGLFSGEHLIAAFLEEGRIADVMNPENLERIQFEPEVTFINKPWDIFSKNGDQLERDYNLLTEGRTSQPISDTNTIIGDRIFLEEGAVVEAAILNSTSGPIYIGKDAEVMEGSIVRGGFALCEHSQLKLGSKIYGPTTVGPHSKVGGEVNNSVITGYSNKGHDGFLGNSVLGEWCNIGADSNTSNLKNNYDEVKLWNYGRGGFDRTGLQFCGLIMGDHSKCGINTMFNTGTVVGVSANIYGSGFPRNFVPSFAWGGASGFTEYRVDKAIQTMDRVMGRRGLSVTPEIQVMIEHIYKETAKFRNFS